MPLSAVFYFLSTASGIYKAVYFHFPFWLPTCIWFYPEFECEEWNFKFILIYPVWMEWIQLFIEFI